MFADGSDAEGADPGGTWGPGQGKCNSKKQRGGQHWVTWGRPDPGSTLGAEPLSAPSAGPGHTSLGVFPTYKRVDNGR